ncbi:MAG: DUF998 domain-containing protein [Promethearchaeota archaeon]
MVKFSAIAGMVIWIGSVIIALLVGQLDPAGPSYDPAGFNPAINYISDLGNQDLTPMPIIINWGMMNTALLMIPVSLHLKKILIGDDSKLLRKLLANVSVLCMLIAMVGLFFTGVISEDVGEVWDNLFPIGYPWHDLVADFAFTFLLIAGILISTQCILYPDILEKNFGITHPTRVRIIYVINSWILTPVFFYMFYTVPYLWYTDNFWTKLPWWQWAPVWEWLLMISLNFWLTSAAILTVKQINRELQK